MKGFLLKQRQERTSNLIGAKYKRRYVELTPSTFVYAASPQEAASSGHIAVFAIADMLFVRSDGDTKFTVKFPERTLKFKVESGGPSGACDSWVAAIKGAKQQQAAAEEARKSGHGGLEKLQQALLQHEPHGDIINASLTSASDGLTLCLSEPGSLHTSGAGAAHAAAARLSTRGSTGDASFIPLDTSLSACQQPPSPRALLACATAGLALLGTSSGASPPAAVPPAARVTHHGLGCAQQQAQQHPGRAGGGSLWSPAGGSGLHGSSGAAGSDASSDAGDGDGSRDSSEAGAAAASTCSQAQLQQQQPRDTQLHTPAHNTRASLNRQLTPGVLLAASTLAACATAGQQGDPAPTPAGPAAAAPQLCSAVISSDPQTFQHIYSSTLYATAALGSSRVAASPPTAAAGGAADCDGGADGNEVLRLDDVLTLGGHGSSGSSKGSMVLGGASTERAVVGNSSSGSRLQGGVGAVAASGPLRPGSAGSGAVAQPPAARPVTPLKSCLKSSSQPLPIL